MYQHWTWLGSLRSCANLVFYMLRVGEYTQERRRTNIHTIQSRFYDISFKQEHDIILSTSMDDIYFHVKVLVQQYVHMYTY